VRLPGSLPVARQCPAPRSAIGVAPFGWFVAGRRGLHRRRTNAIAAIGLARRNSSALQIQVRSGEEGSLTAFPGGWIQLLNCL